ncbi:MAG: TetR family transcriptional regulator [Rhodococcus sp. (in: high G+C Gram-positive bacteria)]|nr:TetR family transcriptional regulator [Rhodococcus sp. (in: high G+C Gram-positive bacteria)]MDI6628155.1 TetR family transcriptional regulator [Rhodococcus sp. (in: high G+C Gram-positive bacteria)]
MARVSRFTLADRRQAVARAFGGSESPAAVATSLGIHTTTLYRWAGSSTTDEPGPAAARLIEATQDLLRDADYADITIESVALRCGLAPRTAFHHFPTKRVLFQAAVDDAATVLIDRIHEKSVAATWPGTPLEQLQTFLRIAAESIYDSPRTHVLFRNLGVPRSEGSAERWHDSFVVAISQLLRAAAEAHQIESDTDVLAAARLLTGAMRGIHTAVFEGGDADTALSLVERVHLLVPPR